MQSTPTETKTVFVVDDDIDVLDQLVLALKPEGYRVLRAQSAAEAEEMILTTRPDLVIVDLMMEEKDSGLVLCNSFKRLYSELPVIIVSNITPTTGMDLSPRSPEERSWVKADLILNKPVVPEHLRGEVRRLINRGQSAQSAHA
jgi:CheY-like chemotaxis protein